jgi:hypothetical protein
MTNRIDQFFEDGKKPTDVDMQKLQALMVRMAEIGDELYDMMDPGLTVTLKLPANDTAIIQLNKKPHMRRLLITRPKLHLEIDVPKGGV